MIDADDPTEELTELEARDQARVAYRLLVDGIENVVGLAPQERLDLDTVLKEARA